VQLVQKLIDGVAILIDVEKQLAGGSTAEKVLSFIRGGFKAATAVIETSSIRHQGLRRSIIIHKDDDDDLVEEDDLDDFGMKEVQISDAVQAVI